MTDWSLVPFITEEHVNTVCQPGSPACCRYLTMTWGGWECVKLSPETKAYIDARIDKGEMVAEGDNCDGRMGSI